jgi:hypothetical protein
LKSSGSDMDKQRERLPHAFHRCTPINFTHTMQKKIKYDKNN